MNLLSLVSATLLSWRDDGFFWKTFFCIYYMIVWFCDSWNCFYLYAVLCYYLDILNHSYIPGFKLHWSWCPTFYFIYLFIYFLFSMVLGFELRTCALSHSTSPFLWWVFSRQGFMNYLSLLALNHDPPDICLLSS
jgi:hypothetical protein